jgi:dTMP kinase
MAAMTMEAELLLFCASRAQLVREVIQPALAEGHVVMADRFFDSTMAYQGRGRKMDAKVIEFINSFVTGECRPQLTVLIDLDPRIGLERARGRELFDRMENQTLDFYERVRQGYLDIARQEPDRVKVVDGNQSIAALQQQIWELIQHVL